MSTNHDNDINSIIINHLNAFDDEKKERCIHCGNEWYAKHYKDGVCYKCQNLKLPGRSEMIKKEEAYNRRHLIKRLIITIVIFVIISYFVYY